MAKSKSMARTMPVASRKVKSRKVVALVVLLVFVWGVQVAKVVLGFPSLLGRGQKATEDDGWIQVARRKPTMKLADEGGVAWKSRASDWDAPVASYASLSAELTKASGAAFRAVVLCDDELRDVVASLLRGSGEAYGVCVIVIGNSPDAERCPGTIGAKVAFRTVTKTQFVTKDVAPPGPAAKAQTKQKVAEVQTVVLYAKCNMGRPAWICIGLLDFMSVFSK